MAGLTYVCFVPAKGLIRDLSANLSNIAFEVPLVHTDPFSNENGAALLRIRLSSTLQRQKRSRSHSKTLSRVKRFENDAFWKRCFVVWTKKTMLSENGGVIKIETTGRQTTRPWLSKMADRRCHVASVSRQFRGHASSSFEHVHWGDKSAFKTDMDGRKRYEND